MASQKATAGAAYEEALAHLDNALSVFEGEESERVADLTAQKAAALRSLGRWDEAIDTSGKAISMFENVGAVAKMAEASFTLAMIHAWRLEYAAANRTIERALECLGSAEPGSRLKLLSLRATIMSQTGDVVGAASLRADLGRRKTPQRCFSTSIRCNGNRRPQRPGE
jgi:tetratricopeptide (TPR) repeat protein